MDPLQHLLRYFPSGTAEGEKQILNEVFVSPYQLGEILSAPVGNPRILLGRKGVGKTAILERLHSIYSSLDVPSLLIRPDDIDLSSFEGKMDVASLKRGAYSAILEAIANKIGSDLKGFLTGPAAVLYNEAVKSGSRDASYLAKIIEVIRVLSKPIANINGPELLKKLSPKVGIKQINSALDSQLDSTGSVAYLFLDDTDQVASADDPSHKNRIWALLLAVRKLAQDCPHVRIVLTLRTEVWMRLTRNERGQRDQIDHIRPLTMTLRASEAHMMEIVNQRIHKAGREINGNVDLDAAYLLFFERRDVKLPSTQERRTWASFLLKSARERPRDIIQLVHRLIKHSLEIRSNKIGDASIDRVMAAYSKEKTEDLAVEMGEVCSNFLEVARCFAGHSFDWDFEELINLLSKVPSRFGIYIYGNSLTPNSSDDALILLSLIHESEFLNCRIEDKSQPRGFRHINFLDDPHLVQKDRWNELQALNWEVHPLFRSYLLSL